MRSIDRASIDALDSGRMLADILSLPAHLTDAVWLNLPGDVTVIGATGYLNDALPSPGQRFYRIVLSP